MKQIISNLFVVIFFLSCNSKENQREAGLCLSFDDNYLEQWVEILPILKKYDVKVTFFLTGVGNLNEEEKDWLMQIYLAGHEIGSHGEYHFMMNNYIKEYGLCKYYEKEINENLNAFDELGIKTQVFAYPYGEKNWYIDALLLFKFQMTRNVSITKDLLNDNEDLFIKLGSSKRKLVSLGIDGPKSIQLEDLGFLFDKAVSQNKILLMHAHQIGTEDGLYKISKVRLESILKLAKNKGLIFYTFGDIAA